MPPLETALLGSLASRISCSVVSMCTNMSVAMPPEYSHQQRHRKNRSGLQGILGADPRKRFQSTVSGDASGGIGYTQAPSLLLRKSAARTRLILPNTPDFTISRALAVTAELLGSLPICRIRSDFFIASRMR